MTTTPTSNQGGSNVVNWIDSIDLSKYPELAQRVAVMNQIGLSLTESDILAQTMEAQGKFMAGSVLAGFGSAGSTLGYGIAEAAIGAGQAGASGTQVYSSIGNIKDLKALGAGTNTALSDLKSLKTSNTLTITEDNELQDATKDTTTTTATNERAIAKEEKPDLPTSRKEILNRHKNEQAILEQNQEGTKSKAQIINAMSQSGQIFAQNAQGNSQVYQMQQQVMNSNFSTTQAAGQTSSDTLRKTLEFDPYAQNVASSRA
jgi:flagellar biosynthesis GTPase FlhF